MKLSKDNIRDILVNNPNKSLVEYGKEAASLLSAVVLGKEYTEHLKKLDYFEGSEIHTERLKATSNIDLFGRILQRESMVFSARGGSVLYNTTDKAVKDKIDQTISNIRIGMSLRSWVKEICNRAYETDPMGVVYMEKSKDGKEVYPTYKSIGCVFDYLPKGRSLEYVVFNMSFDSIKKEYPNEIEGQYFRVVDDEKDYIVKLEAEQVRIIDTLPHSFGKTPAFIVSDIVDFQDTKKFKSKLWQIVELGLKYMEDRSIRDLSKKYHGFPKAVMPMVTCGNCKGTGYIDGHKCETCNGSGFTTIKKVSDRIDLPLNLLEENIGFDIRKILTYAVPDIKTWNKQDDSLNDMEVLMSDCFWGTDYRRFTSGAFMEESVEETATKTMINLQPVYARLERTAEWAEQTEKLIIDFIGKSISAKYQSSTVIYGRDYILESSNELLAQYQKAKSNGAPLYELNALFERYLLCKYQNNPTELALSLKLMQVEPLIHYTTLEAKTIGVSEQSLKEKIYFADWMNTLSNDYLFATKAEKLRDELKQYVTGIELLTTKQNDNEQNERKISS